MNSSPPILIIFFFIIKSSSTSVFNTNFKSFVLIFNIVKVSLKLFLLLSSQKFKTMLLDNQLFFCAAKMDYLQLEVVPLNHVSSSTNLLNSKTSNKRKRNQLICETSDMSNPARQRTQANARERDRTHRYQLYSSSKLRLEFKFKIITKLPREPPMHFVGEPHTPTLRGNRLLAPGDFLAHTRPPREPPRHFLGEILKLIIINPSSDT